MTPCNRCSVLAALAIVVGTASFSSGQELADLPRMYFADAVSGRPFSKDPAVVKCRGRYWLYYSLPPYEGKPTKGWSIGIATSKNLVDWEKAGELTGAGEAEQNGFCAPGAIVLHGKVHLFYQTYGNGPKDAICHAWSEDGLRFTRNPANPVFRPKGDWTCGRAIDADVIEHQGRLLLYWATRDPAMKVQVQGVAAAPLESDFARDKWTQLNPDGPILRPELPWEGQCIEAAAMARRDGRLYMFYAGNYNNQPQQIGVAASDDGVRFKRLFQEPFLPSGPPGSWNSSESGHPFLFQDDDGQDYLFYQGNHDKGRTWHLSVVPVDWQEGKPVLAPHKLPPPAPAAGTGAATGAERTFDVRDFGAVGDGKTLSTAAIQKAIDQCAAQGGGAVRLPAGTWLCGTVYLQSNLTLVIEKGSTLLGSRKHEDYALPRAAGEGKPEFRYAAILAGSDLQNVTIRGEGTIDGQGDAFLDKSKLRPKNIYLQRCRKVAVEGVRLRNAGCWMQHYRLCEDLTIRGIDVFNHAAYNNDGLNVDSCTRVLIEKCRVDSDDDGIVLKSLSLDPCRHVVVRGCTVSSHCNAIKMGTESGGGFQDVEVTGCTVHSPKESKKIYGAQRGLAGIALEIVDGGTMDRVTVSDVRIDGVTAAVFLRLGNRARTYVPQAPKPGVGTLRNVVLRNITAENTSETGCSITGLPGHPVRDVVLEDLKLGFDGGGTSEQAARQIPERPESYPESTMFGTLPAYGFYCRHVEGLVFRNVELRTRRPDLRHAMLFDDVKRLEIDSLQADCAKGAAAVVRMVQVDGAAVRRSKAPAGAEPFLLLEGEKTRRIVLKDNDLSAAAKAVEFGAGASEAALAEE